MQKSIATILSFLLLFGGSGMVFGQHFCNGHLVDKTLAFGIEKMSCAPAEANNSCENSIYAADCCENIYYQIQIENDFVKKSFEGSYELPVLMNTAKLVVLFSASLTQKIPSETHYLTPEFEDDWQSLYQVYLI